MRQLSFPWTCQICCIIICLSEWCKRATIPVTSVCHFDRTQTCLDIATALTLRAYGVFACPISPGHRSYSLHSLCRLNASMSVPRVTALAENDLSHTDLLRRFERLQLRIIFAKRRQQSPHAEEGSCETLCLPDLQIPMLSQGVKGFSWTARRPSRGTRGGKCMDASNVHDSTQNKVGEGFSLIDEAIGVHVSRGRSQRLLVSITKPCCRAAVVGPRIS